jgi:hypothetical protein
MIYQPLEQVSGWKSQGKFTSRINNESLISVLNVMISLSDIEVIL